jgi:MinD-like ATPase involved in chromosome partitioning or flagellar assembly/nitrogen-specific signal transduction histidine kinase/HD-like signal output (HDOD) protein
MARIIIVTSGKGGVGKTNISVNLAGHLAHMGYRSCLFDADLGLANANILLGLYPEYTIEDVLSGEKALTDVMIRDVEGIDIIPGSSGVEKVANLEPDELGDLVASFSMLDAYDHVIVDTASGVSKNVISFCLAASEIVLVMTPEPTSLTDAYALLKILSLNHYRKPVMIVVNQCPNRNAGKIVYTRFNKTVQKYLPLDIMFLGDISADYNLVEAVKEQKLFISRFPDSPASKDIRRITEKLNRKEATHFEEAAFDGFFTNYINFMKGHLRLSVPRSAGNTGKAEPGEQKNDPARLPEFPDGSPYGGAKLKTDRMGAVRRNPETVFERPDEQIHLTAHASAGLKEKINRFSNLPCIPQVLVRLLHACGGDAATPEQLAQISSKDPSLAAKILQMVHPVSAGSLGKMRSLENAVAVLGRDVIRNVAINASVLQAMQANDRMDQEAWAALTRFWRHSILCASIARRIATEMSYPLPEEAFLSGLLHDIGKLMLWVSAPSNYTGLSPGDGNRTSHMLEQEKTLGGTHSALGAWYIRRKPHHSIMADAVLYHHDRMERVADALPLVKIVYAANTLSREHSRDLQKGLDTAETFFGFSPSRTGEIVSLAREEAAREARDLGIVMEGSDPAVSGIDTRVGAGGEYQEDLQTEIREISLLQGTLQHLLKADSRESIFRIAAQGLQAMFNLEKVIFFSYDHEKHRLTGVSPGGAPLMRVGSDLEIPFENQNGLIVRSLLEGCAVSSFPPLTAGRKTIADEQILSLLGADGMLCIPMAAHGNRIGVMVIGLSRERQTALAGGLKALTTLAGHIGGCLYSENIREEQIRTAHAEFLETSELMARRVTHEVANPLGIIKNYIKILELKFQEKAFDSEELRVINEEIERILHIVNQLSGFYQTSRAAVEFIDINFLLSDLLTIMTPSILEPAGIKTHFNPDISLPLVVSDKNSLKHVFINLVKNAAESMTGGGNLYLGAKLARPADLTNSADERMSSNAVEVIIRDDGPGIPENVKPHLFEPFNSSKGDGHSGLGLSIAYNIIRDLKGILTWKSSKGAGTQFCITLPLRKDEK